MAANYLKMWEQKENIKALIKNQVIFQLGLNNLKVEKGSYEIMDMLVYANQEQWDKIIQLVYQKYPNLRGVVVFEEFIYKILDSLQSEIIEKFNADQYEELAEIVAGVTIDFFAGYTKIVQNYMRRNADAG